MQSGRLPVTSGSPASVPLAHVQDIGGCGRFRLHGLRPSWSAAYAGDAHLRAVREIVPNPDSPPRAPAPGTLSNPKQAG